MTPELSTAIAGIIVALTALIYAKVNQMNAAKTAQESADKHADLAQRVANVETVVGQIDAPMKPLTGSGYLPTYTDPMTTNYPPPKGPGN